MTYDFRNPLLDYHSFPKYDKIENNNYIYLLKDDKVLKLLITIDKKILEECLYVLNKNLVPNDYELVILDNLKTTNYSTILETTHKHRRFIRYKLHKIPDKKIYKCKLIYLINDIYNEDISSDSLCRLNNIYDYYSNVNNGDRIATKWVEVINNIIDNLEINVLEEYGYDIFQSSLDFMELVIEKENLYSKLDLTELKDILLEAQKNKVVFESLNIKIQFEKEYRK